MRITRETLIRIAKETAQKAALEDRSLVAAYLTGSLRGDSPFLGNASDVDIVLVHAGTTRRRRVIQPLTPEAHLDIVHLPRSEFDKPKELRVHPWLGPQLYDPLPLYGTQHFFEFVQAGVRAGYEQPANVLARARRNALTARQVWASLHSSQENCPATLCSYLKAVNHAANAIALLNGDPLAERRFMLQFQVRAAEAGVPGLSSGLVGLLGGNLVDAARLRQLLPDWESTFADASSRAHAHPSLQEPRLEYYRQAFVSLLGGDFPQAILWPLMNTWTRAAIVVPPTHQAKWNAACETLGLNGSAFEQRLEGLDLFLDRVDEVLENKAAENGL